MARLLVQTGKSLATLEARRLTPAPKTAKPIYGSPEHKAWRAAVIARAGGRCEAIVDGRRCRKAEPIHRMFADHKVELADGGPPFDVSNGQCLCGAHHTAKTAAARRARAST